MAAETVNPNDGVAAYLKRPYARVVVPETDGTFRAEILEFPGCFATGDTPVEALAEIEEVAAAWLSAAVAQKQTIPEPLEHAQFSGRLVLRMPRGLHKKAARLAQREGVSLNQFIVTGLAEKIGMRAREQNQITLNTIPSSVNLGIFVSHQSHLGYASFVTPIQEIRPRRFQIANPSHWVSVQQPLIQSGR